MRVIIVDDEHLARALLREYLAGHPDIEIVAECANGFEAVKAIGELQPDLVFLDIQMPKLDGFEVVELAGARTRYVFVTAYDQFALKAFEVRAIDYLLKPFSRADQAVFTPHLYEIDGPRLTCCGGAASVDFALTLIETIFGSTVQAQVKEILCVDRVRGREERQRVALQARFGTLQPKLTEAVTLMEANIEEPLSTDEIAQLAGVSRRQLERLFKQYLGSLPSRYYLELRLKRARQLLLDTNYSIVQVGLMCGFSSGSHFSTAFGALFGNTPREERQRRLAE